MHDRALAPLSRRRSPQQTATLRATLDGPGAAPEEAYAGVALLDHAGLPRILSRRARWMTSRLRQR
ncbi:hypothetical protein GXW83_01590 [Streptacidiphilus sp. PB12-B1b]|uniref:hypothetical protein n=1 Tax=Streptacidiphilus sp. PB12-B1b TaxID=2705012 RepID=UPI0015F8F710|nr:hypothetical protein [Streptacidiphilus sp. PB12-B1b]QMU74668.1 hypothetical protein GXW83_01590 [Streptacidiphilus sp. PB12-B1b]